MKNLRLKLSIAGIALIAFGLGLLVGLNRQFPVAKLISKPVYHIPETNLSLKPQMVIALINNEREKEGLKSFKENNILDYVAYLRALDIVKNNELSHEATKSGRRYSEITLKAGYWYEKIGENLAVGFDNPEGLIKDWLLSKTHRDNILSKEFEEVGVYIIKGNQKLYPLPIVTVAIFGKNTQSSKD